MRLDKNSLIPLYIQLHDILLERIEQGVYLPNQKMPSENQLCREFSMSRPTVRQAMAELQASGIITIEKGRGTYVNSRNEHLTIQNFTALSCSFMRPKADFFKTISQTSIGDELDLTQTAIELVPHEQKLDQEFNLANQLHPGYWSIKRILTAGDRKLGILQSLIPVAFFPELAQQVSTGRTLLQITGNKYAYLPQKGHLYARVTAASNEEASELDIARHSPILNFYGKLLGRNGLVCEVLNLTFVPDLVEVEIH